MIPQSFHDPIEGHGMSEWNQESRLVCSRWNDVSVNLNQSSSPELFPRAEESGRQTEDRQL